MSVDSDGQLVERGFRIVGIFKSMLDAEEKGYVFTGIQPVSNLLGVDEDITEITLRLTGGERDLSASFLQKTRGLFSDRRVDGWRELQPLVEAIVRVQDGVLWVWYIIVMVTVAFGLVNTLFMAIFERIREIGLYRALGMRRGGVIASVLFESFFLLVIGLCIGNALTFLIVSLLSQGIDLSQFAKGTAVIGLSKVVYPSLKFDDVFDINALVLCIGLASSFYPAWRAGMLEPAVGLSKS
jgi:ABC-type lipoprotein release transport system permease subunit